MRVKLVSYPVATVLLGTWRSAPVGRSIPALC